MLINLMHPLPPSDCTPTAIPSNRGGHARAVGIAGVPALKAGNDNNNDDDTNNDDNDNKHDNTNDDSNNTTTNNNHDYT